MRVLVLGGADLADWPLVKAALDHWRARLPITVIIEGGADQGADELARRWAWLRSLELETVPKTLRRETAILFDYGAELVIAFTGTSERLLKSARDGGLKVIEVAGQLV